MTALLRIHAAFIAFGTRDYECSTTCTVTLVHPYTGERKPIANCDANMPTYYALLEQGWIDDDEMSNNGNTQPEDTGERVRG